MNINLNDKNHFSNFSNCPGCLLRSVIDLIDDNYILNRNIILENLYRFDISRYCIPMNLDNSNRCNTDVKKLSEIITDVENGIEKEDLLQKLQLLSISWDFIRDDERKAINKFYFLKGKSVSTKRV